jgi:hypothetical protein
LTAIATGKLRPCGDCSLCCKVYEFMEISKPAGEWCRHFAPGQRCTIHDVRPNQCRSYQCAWTLNEFIDDAWKPDMSHFVMDIRPTEVLVISDPDRPGSWKREPYYSRLKAISARVQRPFMQVTVLERGNVTIVFPEADVELGPNRRDCTIDSGYDFKDGKRIPYARFTPITAAS